MKTPKGLDYQAETVMVEVKSKLSGTRDLRNELVKLVQNLIGFPEKKAYLLLINPRLGKRCLETELRQFKEALLPDIAQRLAIVLADDQGIVDDPSRIPPSDYGYLQEIVRNLSTEKTELPRPDMQSEVFRVLLHEWVSGRGPITSSWMENTVGCSYRTVAAVLQKLDSAIERGSDRRVELKYFPENDFAKLLTIAPEARSTMLYADRSGQPRSPESLVKRLGKLGHRDHIALGGVIGTKSHFPELDLVGSPRLDLCIHCPDNAVDLAFVRQLDPGLHPAQNRQEPVRLALHFLRRKKSLFKMGSGMTVADPVECLLDLYEANLIPQAHAFATFLIHRAEQFHV